MGYRRAAGPRRSCRRQKRWSRPWMTTMRTARNLHVVEIAGEGLLGGVIVKQRPLAMDLAVLPITRNASA